MRCQSDDMLRSGRKGKFLKAPLLLPLTEKPQSASQLASNNLYIENIEWQRFQPSPLNDADLSPPFMSPSGPTGVFGYICCSWPKLAARFCISLKLNES